MRYCHYLRFYTHLLIYLRYLDVPVQDENGDKILLLYIDVLQVCCNILSPLIR